MMQISDAEWQVMEDYLDAGEADQYGFDRGSGGQFPNGPKSNRFKLFWLVWLRERVFDSGKKKASPLSIQPLLTWIQEVGFTFQDIGTRFVPVGLRTCWLI